MAISLEVKKFVNTEYVGKFAEIELPIAQPEDEEPPRKARKKPDKKDKKEKKASFIRKRADYDGDDDDYDDIDSEIEAEPCSAGGAPTILTTSWMTSWTRKRTRPPRPWPAVRQPLRKPAA